MFQDFLSSEEIDPQCVGEDILNPENCVEVRQGNFVWGRAAEGEEEEEQGLRVQHGSGEALLKNINFEIKCGI